MSILKSTKTGWKYYYPQEIVKDAMIMLHGDERVVPNIVDHGDGTISILPPVEKGELKMEMYNINVNRSDCPSHWKITMPFAMLFFIGLSKETDYTLIIRNDFTSGKAFKIKEIVANIKIECNLEDYEAFQGCKVQGHVFTGSVNQFDIWKKGLHPYFGKSIVGF